MADEMGYRPNAIARSLKIGRTFNLGVLYSTTPKAASPTAISPPCCNPSSRRPSAGATISPSSPTTWGTQDDPLEHCRYRNVDGVCIVCSHFDDGEVLQLVSSSLPLVTIDHVFNNRACIQSENRQGVEALTRHVLSMGHKKSAFVYGAEDTVSDIRLTTLLRTMNEAGSPFRMITPSPPRTTIPPPRERRRRSSLRWRIARPAS